MAKIAPPPVHQVALIQLLILLLLSLALLPFGQKLAASAAVGGLIQIIPQVWFTRQAYRYTGARQVRNIVNAMYRGESGKILLTTAMFAIVFRMARWVEPVTLFVSFGVMILVQLLSATKILNRAR
ncbi:ATP synthase subunit I [Porticoccus sp. W117]|uniref:ATP synthase subunit I n=1 Tax=Porticoccus sp. W117 TaxID=3054777 RepID=UPI0025996A84|nr:ATP synthase subunit I [Porticoccus sp. W117]MDM3870786.1 ATP synthase subunit I [Porticoccus sp. W117]